MKNTDQKYQNLQQEFTSENFEETQEFYQDMKILLENKQNIEVPKELSTTILSDSKVFLKELKAAQSKRATALPQKTTPFPTKKVLIATLSIAAAFLIFANIWVFLKKDNTPMIVQQPVPIQAQDTTSNSLEKLHLANGEQAITLADNSIEWKSDSLSQEITAFEDEVEVFEADFEFSFASI